jgi:hypothetical protein
LRYTGLGGAGGCVEEVPMTEPSGITNTIHYWTRPGPDNTAGTIERAVRRAGQLGIQRFVVASNTGATARLLHQAAPAGSRIVCVTHSVGFRKPGEDELSVAARQELREAGVTVLTTTHFLAGVDRALRFLQGGLHPAEIVALSLRILGQGLKVAVEIATMATDAGLLPPGEAVLALGGTGHGADTALVVRPAHGQSFFETRVVELVCLAPGAAAG